MVERDGARLHGRRSASSRSSAPAATRSTSPRRPRRRSAIPEGVSDATALALLLQGLTAWHLYRTSAQARAGRERRRARRGGRRRLARRPARQAARRRPRDRDRARPRRSARSRSSWAPTPRSTSRARTSRTRWSRRTCGERVDVVLEMAGGRVFDASLDALAPFGRLVTYGIASREPNTVSTGALMRKSRAVVGFWLMHCLRRPAEMVDAPLQELFERAAAGELRVVEGETYPLSEVRRAHEDLQARRTSGKLVLDPIAASATSPRPAGSATRRAARRPRSARSTRRTTSRRRCAPACRATASASRPRSS